MTQTELGLSCRTLLGALALIGRLAQGETLTLPPSTDTTLFEASPNNNLGGVSTLAVGGTGTSQRARALIRFDLSGLPPTAVAQSASLSFSVVKAPPGGTASNFQLHRALVDWGEGVQSSFSSGSLADADEATWLARFSSGALWSAPGGSAPADYSGTVSSSVLVNALGKYTLSSTPELVADVQAWINAPAANFGWLIISDAEEAARSARRVASREDPAESPTLTLEYTTRVATEPSQPQLADPAWSQGTFSVKAPTQTGFRYVLEHSDTVGGANWQAGASWTGDGATVALQDFETIVPARFYRVRVEGPFLKLRAESEATPTKTLHQYTQ